MGVPPAYKKTYKVACKNTYKDANKKKPGHRSAACACLVHTASRDKGGGGGGARKDAARKEKWGRVGEGGGTGT